MIRGLLALLGRGFVLLAMMAFFTGVSLFVVGAYLATCPLMRLSPRNARMRAMSDLALAGVAVVRAFNESRPSSPKSSPCAKGPGVG